MNDPVLPQSIATAPSIFRVRAFTLLWITRVTSNTSNQMLAVVVGYQVYELTDSALALGLIGLVQFLPPLVLILLAGQIADRFNRRLVMRCSYAVEFAMAVGLLLATLQPQPNLTAIYVLLLVNACARSFELPCVQALVTIMIPRELLGRVVAAHVLGNRNCFCRYAAWIARTSRSRIDVMGMADRTPFSPRRRFL